MDWQFFFHSSNWRDFGNRKSCFGSRQSTQWSVTQWAVHRLKSDSSPSPGLFSYREIPACQLSLLAWRSSVLLFLPNFCVTTTLGGNVKGETRVLFGYDAMNDLSADSYLWVQIHWFIPLLWHSLRSKSNILDELMHWRRGFWNVHRSRRRISI